MKKAFLETLCCPICKGHLALEKAEDFDEEDIRSGTLLCSTCGKRYGTRNGIPNFVIKECLATTNVVQKLLYDIYAPFYDVVEEKLAKRAGFNEEALRREVTSSMDIRELDRVLEVYRTLVT